VNLLELLVTLTLVGVLGSLAYPSYRSHLLRAHRMEAIEALLAVAAAQERFYLAHGRYAAGFAVDGVAIEPGLRLDAITPGRRYQVSIERPEPAQFLAHAAPRAGSGQDADRVCARLSIAADGRRSAQDSTGHDTTATCWR
jgi:type IV pilus assembly protein PilE